MLFIVAQAFNLYRWEMTGSARTSHCFFSSVLCGFSRHDCKGGLIKQAGSRMHSVKTHYITTTATNQTNQTKNNLLNARPVPERASVNF